MADRNANTHDASQLAGEAGAAGKIFDMLIIGGGPGGYTAALYAVRAGLTVLVLEQLAPGGQMMLTQQIDNYPGFDNGVDGAALSQAMRTQAERFGAQTVIATVTSVDLHGSPKEVKTDAGTFYAKTMVVATGAQPRELGIPMEREFTGRGVHYCAACDGMFYRDRTVVVVGGGNAAAADAMLLSRVAKQVIVVHRRDTLRATKLYHAPLMQTDNIAFQWNSVVTGLLHDERLYGVRLRDVHTGAQTELLCDGVFVSIGRKPASELVAGQLALDESGYLIAGETTQTAIPGVYAVGDVRTKAVRQIVTAVADGAVAAQYAEDYLANGG